jgi:hypothetical protein
MGEILSNFIESCDECLYRKHKTHLSELENRIYMAEEKIKHQFINKYKNLQTMRQACCDDL